MYIVGWGGVVNLELDSSNSLDESGCDSLSHIENGLSLVGESLDHDLSLDVGHLDVIVPDSLLSLELGSLDVMGPSLEPTEEGLESLYVTGPSLEPTAEELGSRDVMEPSLEPTAEELGSRDVMEPSLEISEEELGSLDVMEPSLEITEEELGYSHVMEPSLEITEEELESLYVTGSSLEPTAEELGYSDVMEPSSLGLPAEELESLYVTGPSLELTAEELCDSFALKWFVPQISSLDVSTNEGSSVDVTNMQQNTNKCRVYNRYGDVHRYHNNEHIMNIILPRNDCADAQVLCVELQQDDTNGKLKVKIYCADSDCDK